MKIKIEKSCVQELACIAQVVSILGAGMKITSEMEQAARKALDDIDVACPDLDLTNNQKG